MPGRWPSKAPRADAADVLSDEDLRYFERQRHQADLAQRSLAEGRVKAGQKGAYMAFHDGRLLGRAPDAQGLAPSMAGFERADVFVMYVPGRSDVLVY